MSRTTHVWATPADKASVVQEHSMGETIATAHLTASPDGHRTIVEYGKRVKSGDRDVSASILLNLAYELVAIALDDLPEAAASEARCVMASLEHAGHLQRRALGR